MSTSRASLAREELARVSSLDRRVFLSSLLSGFYLAQATAVRGEKPAVEEKIGSDLKPITTADWDELPKGAITRLGSSNFRLSNNISAVRFSGNSTHLIAADSDEIRAYDPATGKVLFRYNYPAAVSTNSGELTTEDSFALLVRPSSGGRSEIQHFAFRTGKLLARSEPLPVDNIDQSDFSRDGQVLAVIHGHRLFLFDAKTGKQRWDRELPNETIGGVRVGDSGKEIFVAKKGELRRYLVADGKDLDALKLPPVPKDAKNGSDWLTNPVISHDGQRVAASVGDDLEHVGVWETKTGKYLYSCKPARQPLGFLPDGTLLTHEKGSVTLWNAATGAKVRDIRVMHTDTPTLARNGRWLATEAADGVTLIDIATGKPTSHSADPPGRPGQMTFVTATQLRGNLSPWGAWIEWDTATSKSRLLQPKDRAAFGAYTLSHDGLVGVRGLDNTYAVEHLGTGDRLLTETLPEEQNAGNAAQALTITPNGQFAVFSNGNGLALVELATKQRTILRHQRDDINKNAVLAITSANNQMAFLAPTRGDLHVVDAYDLGKRQFRQRLAVTGDIHQIECTADGQIVAVGHRTSNPDRGDMVQVTVFEVVSGSVLHRTPEEDTSTNAMLALAPDGRTVARVGKENTLVVDEVGVGPRFTFEAKKLANCLALSPDGRLLASSQPLGPVILWHLYPRPTDVQLSGALLKHHWEKLLSGTASEALTSITTLMSQPSQTLPFLRTSVPPSPKADIAAIHKNIAELDHAQYRRRELAFKALQAEGERATTALREALTRDLSPEARERVERLLRTEQTLTPEQRRIRRVIEIVERIATPDATALLTHWSQGAEGTLLTREATMAKLRLERLKA